MLWALDAFMRSFGILHSAFSKSTSSHVAWINSPLRTRVSKIRRRPSLMVGYETTCSIWDNITRISLGESARSYGTKVAIDDGPTAAAGGAAGAPGGGAGPGT